MVIRYWIVVITLLAGVFGAGPAAGQDAPEPTPPAAPEPAPPAASAPDAPDLRVRAKERFVRGVALAKSGAWDAALAEFLASRALFPTRVALENAAISLRELRRFVESRAMYRELLASFGANLRPDEHAAMTREIEELDALVGEIVIESRPSGAVVVVDGEERGLTPLAAPIAVNSGTRSVRVSKAGYERYEAQLTIAGREQKRVVAALEPLERVGTLVVREAVGRELDVAVDGVIVGKTPWQGPLAPGAHSVALRSASELGTAPSSALVRENQVVTLVLRAERLDAALRVEPLPSNGRVFVDGVDVGSGVWQGRLRSGAHRVEVIAEAHVPYSRSVTLDSGRVETVRAVLDRDLSHPQWRVGFSPHAYVEVLGGPLFAPSLGGGAEAACGGTVRDLEDQRGPGCSDRERPFGFLVGARGGYLLREQLGLEVFVGYLSLRAEQVRRVRAAIVAGFTDEAFSSAVDDSTEVSGPLAALSAAYFLPGSPFGVRLWAGVLRARVETANRGTYIGSVADEPFERAASIPERVQHVWVPLVGPEISVSYRFSRAFSMSANVAGLLLVPLDTPRTGERGPVTMRSGERIALLSDIGNLSLPEEDALGTAFAVLPSLGARVDF